MKINNVNNYQLQNRNNAAFGHVIPVKIKLNGKILEPAKVNEDFYKSVIISFTTRIGKAADSLFEGLAKKFKAVDSDFDGTLHSIRSKDHPIWGVRRYFVTGADKNWQNKAGHDIGYYASKDKKAAYKHYREVENSLTENPAKRIKDVVRYVIDVITEPTTKKDGTQGELKKIIIGGDFEMVKPKTVSGAVSSAPVKPVTAQPPIKTVASSVEPQKAVSEVTQKIQNEPQKPISVTIERDGHLQRTVPAKHSKSKNKENPNQLEFDFVKDFPKKNLD